MDSGDMALDLHEHLGVDLTDEVWESRSWRWILGRAKVLLDNDRSRLHRKAVSAHGRV